MKPSQLKRYAGIAILLFTVVAFVFYFINNPSVWQSIKNTPLTVLVAVIVLYMISIAALAWVTVATVKLCRLELKYSESVLLSMYTAIVNFFGPLQSGPAFRGLYLKQKHQLSIKLYAAATSLYYLIWGLVSSLLLLSGLIKWGIVPVVIVLLVLGLFIRQKTQVLGIKILDLRPFVILTAATIVQITIISLIYFVEVRSLMPGVSYHQILIYTGAANLALFVSLTPGAIGFREAFLIFSQRLHGIPTDVIVAANTIDRAMYFVVLGLLALYVFGFHAVNKLGIKNDP